MKYKIKGREIHIKKLSSMSFNLKLIMFIITKSSCIDGFRPILCMCMAAQTFPFYHTSFNQLIPNQPKGVYHGIQYFMLRHRKVNMPTTSSQKVCVAIHFTFLELCLLSLTKWLVLDVRLTSSIF